jgi:hypothetical protein
MEPRVYQYPVPPDGDCLYSSLALALKMPGNENLYHIFNHLSYYHANTIPNLKNNLYDVELFTARHLRIFIATVAIQDITIANNYREHLENMFILSQSDPQILYEYPFIKQCADPFTNKFSKAYLYRTMLMPVYWGGEFVLRVIQHYYNIQIVIISSSGKTLLNPPENTLVSLMLYYNGSHYNPIVYETTDNKTCIVPNDKVDYYIGLFG